MHGITICGHGNVHKNQLISPNPGAIFMVLYLFFMLYNLCN